MVNGRVYVGLKDGLALFGLLSIASTPPSAPTTLTAQAAGVARISLTWMDTSTDEGGFKIERSTDGVNFTQIAVAPPNATTFLDTALASSKTYWYRVRATNSAGDSAFTNVANATTVASTLDPTLVAYWALDEGTGVTISDGTGHGHDGTLSGEATWIEGQVGPAAISFHDVGNTYQKISVPNAPDLQFTAVDSYTLSTWANVYDVPTRWSGVVTKSREINPWYGIWISDSGNWVAGAANNLVGPTATVGWHFVSVVQDAAAGTRSLYVDGQFAASGPAADGNGSGELWIGGAAGTNEYFNGAVDDVRLYSRALTPSEISALAFGSNPAAPTDLIATPGNAQVALSWADRSTNETGYELERSTDGVNYTRIATLGMNATSYVDTNLSAQLYWYRVRAVNATGVSAYSNIASTQPLVPAPTAPAGLSAVALTPTNVVLSWTNTSSTATAVEVERSTDGGTFSRIASLGATAITYTDTTVSAGSNYFYRVRAVASGGTVSPYSSVVQVSTLSAGLVARWTFDEGTGTTAADATGLGHTATLTPGAAWTGGQVGGAAVTFSGGAKAVVNDAPDLRFTAGQSFTLSTWANVLALTSAWSAIVAKSRDSGPWYGIWISSANTWVAGGPVNLNGPKVTTGWHSLVLVQDAAAGSRSLYVDGQLAVSGPAQDGTGGSALTMGGANAVNEPFNGSLDDTRLYSRALSPAEIASLASSFNPAAPTNLIATPGNAQVALSWVDRSTVAADSAALVRNRILQQAATAILAQANQQPALALTLLRE